MVLPIHCPANELLFVSSSRKDRRQADGEIARWARAHGYALPQADRTYAIYHDGVLTREWRLLEPRSRA